MAPPSRENAALVRRFLTDVVACGDTNAVAELLAADVEDHHPVFDGTRHRETVTGLGWRALAGANVDLHVEDVVASDDLRLLTQLDAVSGEFPARSLPGASQG